MLKVISRLSMLIQKTVISRYSRANQHDTALHNGKPRTSTSVNVRFDGYRNKSLYQSNEIKKLTSNNSTTLLFSKSFYIVSQTGRIDIPVEKSQYNSEETPRINLLDLIKWLAKTPDDESKDSIQPGARIGRLDAANEAGFFHRTDRSRLKEIKKKLKDKGAEQTEPKKTE